MRITEVPMSAEPAQLQTMLNERMLGAYDKDGSLKVRIRTTKGLADRQGMLSFLLSRLFKKNSRLPSAASAY
jgi:hypothetical protein